MGGKLVIAERKREPESNAPESSKSGSHKHSHLLKSNGIPHSASTIIGKGVSLAMSLRNSGRAYRIGSVGISSSFGGHGGAGRGFE